MVKFEKWTDQDLQDNLDTYTKKSQHQDCCPGIMSMILQRIIDINEELKKRNEKKISL